MNRPQFPDIVSQARIDRIEAYERALTACIKAMIGAAVMFAAIVAPSIVWAVLS